MLGGPSRLVQGDLSQPRDRINAGSEAHMKNLDKWVDPRVRLVKAADLHAYLIARGWMPKPSPRPPVLLFEEPAGHEGEPVLQTVPAHDGVSDYTDAIVRVVTNLAAVEDRSALDVLSDILRQVPAEAVSANGPDGNPPRPRPRKRCR
jgi:hypothetical protein